MLYVGWEADYPFFSSEANSTKRYVHVPVLLSVLDSESKGEQ